MRATPRIYPHHIALPQNLTEILSTIQSHGYRAYIVGGCVRDSLLGIAPKDWDIATSALPQAICEIFAHDTRIKFIHTGSKYGTIGVCIEGVCYEITTFRSDGIYCDARRPDGVEFVRDLAQDLVRRDFSINALAYNPQQGVLDYVDGIKDLQHKRIMCVGDAHSRFSEDSLRILRAMRFGATLGFSIDSQTKDALLELSNLITTLPIERIRLELDKTLLGAYVGGVLEEFAGIFAHLFAHLACQSANLSPTLCKIAAHIDTLDSHLPIRYAWLLGGFDEAMRASLMENLRFSNAHKREICSLLALLSLTPPRDDSEILNLLARFGAQSVCEVLNLWELRYGDLGDLREHVCDLAQNACYELKTLQISGDTIKALKPNIKGKCVGKILQALLTEVIAQKLLNTRESLTKRAKTLIDTQVC